MISLRDYQIEAVQKLRNGSILCGGVGSGKSRTALFYYYICNGGTLTDKKPKKCLQKLYIITTARKRDTKEWESEMAPFSFSDVVIDSWNNIKKYVGVENAFFIFDEQRVVGSGVWVKSFLKITKVNDWILLSATPGDTWMDYIPVFVANGFYRNPTEFKREHVVFASYSKFPKVDRYLGVGRLIRLRNRILVNMDYVRDTVQHHIDILVGYDNLEYKKIIRNRWNYTKDEPIQSASELCYELRKSINSWPERIPEIMRIQHQKKRVIIFYNFDYELEILKNIDFGPKAELAEWNGHKHQDIPQTEEWVYLVQYTAGAEGWNCTKTDTIIFYSQNYSYKVMVQAAGRIDRLNTPYKDLYFYHFKSRAPIDLAISRALSDKKKFNESKFAKF